MKMPVSLFFRRDGYYVWFYKEQGELQQNEFWSVSTKKSLKFWHFVNVLIG